MNYSKNGPSLETQILLQIPVFLIGGVILMTFLGIATLGTAYRTSIAQVVDSRVMEIVQLCQYRKPRRKGNKSPSDQILCSDAKAAKRLVDRGFVLHGMDNYKLTLELQHSPLIKTTLVVPTAEFGLLAVGDRLLVRTPVLRSSEKVELASSTPISDGFLKVFKYAALAYGVLCLICLIFYRRIRRAFVEAYRESTAG